MFFSPFRAGDLAVRFDRWAKLFRAGLYTSRHRSSPSSPRPPVGGIAQRRREELLTLPSNQGAREISRDLNNYDGDDGLRGG